MRYKAIAVRPYPNPLRARVLSVLSAAGIEVEIPLELEGAATNDEVVAYLRGRGPDVLLVPYHALRDRLDERTSGLDLVVRIRTELPELRDVPVVMPLSVFGQVAFEAAWRQSRSDGIVPLFEKDLDGDDAVPALREALRDRQVVR